MKAREFLGLKCQDEETPIATQRDLNCQNLSSNTDQTTPESRDSNHSNANDDHKVPHESDKERHAYLRYNPSEAVDEKLRQDESLVVTKHAGMINPRPVMLEIKHAR